MSVGETHFMGWFLLVSLLNLDLTSARAEAPKPVAGDGEAPCQFWVESRTPICPQRTVLRAA